MPCFKNKSAEEGIQASVLRLLNLTDLHTEEISLKMSEQKSIIVVEETCTGSGIREALAWELMQHCPGCHVTGIDLGRDFVTHGDKKILYQNCGLDPQSIAAYAKEVLRNEG